MLGFVGTTNEYAITNHNNTGFLQVFVELDVSNTHTHSHFQNTHHSNQLHHHISQSQSIQPSAGIHSYYSYIARIAQYIFKYKTYGMLINTIKLQSAYSFQFICSNRYYFIVYIITGKHCFKHFITKSKVLILKPDHLALLF